MHKRHLASEPAAGEGRHNLSVVTRQLRDDHTFPNSALPLLFYHGAVLLPGDDPAAVFERLFATND